MPLPFAGPDRLLAHFQRTGEARSLGKLFDRTAPELLRIAAWLAGNRADAEDLLQRTFLTVLTARGTYDASRRALPWLCGILGNHAKKLHEQRQQRLVDGVHKRECAREPDPAAAAAAAEFATTVARLRTELGSPYAEVLDLHLGDGLDCKQIAERLGRPAGTVRTQLMRGLQRLRQVLPGGFVAGALLTASAQATALATVRAFVMTQAAAGTGVVATAAAGVGGVAAAGGGVMTFGGMVMGNKLPWLAPSLLLLLGGGVFWWQQRSVDAATPTVPAPVVASSLPAAITPAEPTPPPTAGNAPAEGNEREAAEPSDQLAAEPGFATVVVRIRWADDHSPAANVGVLAKPQPASLLTERDGLTDARGTLVLRRIRPGPCWLTSPFTRPLNVDLAPTTVKTFDLDANRTGTIAGRVVDDLQRPVADARLWLSIGSNPFRGFEVGRSDAQGRFRLPFIQGQDIGARKAGHAPSRLLTLNAGSADVTLTLSGAGGTVQGRVVDGDNRPIAEARIEVGAMGGWNVPGSRMAELWKQPTPPMLTTDADGLFVGEGIATGTVEVKAWAVGFGPISEHVVVDAGRPTSVALVLPRGAVVEGTVRDATGRAVVGSTVSRVGNYQDFARPRTESDADGKFRLVDLPTGSVDLVCVTKEGKVEGTVTTTAGATTNWDPIVTAASPPLTGRVVGPDGKPLANVEVGVVPAGGVHANPQTTTDANGAFELRNVDAGSATLLVALDRAWLAIREIVVPTTEPLVVTLTPSEMPSAHLRGRVVDTEGKPVSAGLTIRLPSWRMFPVTGTDANGTFRRGPLPPGDYLLALDAKGYGVRDLGVVRLAPGEDRTLPDIVLPRAGRAELELRGGEASVGGMLMIARDDGVVATWVMPDGNRATAELPPGNYLAVMQIRATRAAATFTVRSEQTTTAVLAFAKATPVTFSCKGEIPSPGDTMQIVVRDAAGVLVDCVLMHRIEQRDTEPVQWRTLLPPGVYAVTARLDDGRVTTTQVTVRDTEAAQTFDIASPMR